MLRFPAVSKKTLGAAFLIRRVYTATFYITVVDYE